jgi:hypothetical protein
MKSKLMSRVLAIAAGVIFTLGFLPATTFAQGTAFTYQGRLNDGAGAANGTYDARFAIYDALTLGTQHGPMLTNSAMAVSNGLFTVTLDFGTGVFNGDARWLEIAARTNGANDFSILSPRQSLTASPYALYAPSAGTAALASSLPSSTITAAMLADGAVTSSKIAPAAVKAANIDDGGSAGYENLVAVSRSFLKADALPFEALLPRGHERRSGGICFRVGRCGIGNRGGLRRQRSALRAVRIRGRGHHGQRQPGCGGASGTAGALELRAEWPYHELCRPRHWLLRFVL